MPTPPSTTVLKAFRLLELFKAHEQLGATEAAVMLGTPRASAHRLLVTLREAGMLEVVDGGQYRLSMRMFELGAQVPLVTRLLEVSRRPLEALTAVLANRVMLATREGDEVLFLERFTHRRTRLPAHMGSRGPLHATAIGKVLLAYAPPEIRADILANPLERFTPYTLVDPAELVLELERIRRGGIGYCSHERRLGIIASSVPIHGPGGEVIAAIDVAMTGDLDQAPARDVELALRRAAGQIERLLQQAVAQPLAVAAGAP